MSPYTVEVPHDLLVRYKCPKCNKSYTEYANCPATMWKCKCGLVVRLKKHPNGRVTVLCDPKEVGGG